MRKCGEKNNNPNQKTNPQRKSSSNPPNQQPPQNRCEMAARRGRCGVPLGNREGSRSPQHPLPPSVPPAAGGQPQLRRRGAPHSAPAAILPCAPPAAPSGRCGAAAEPIKGGGGATGRVSLCVPVPVRPPARSCPRHAGAERRPPPASPARGPAAAAGTRLHVGGRCPRLLRGRRRPAEPGGVLGRGCRQPAAGTRRAGGRGCRQLTWRRGPRDGARGAESVGAPGHGGR